MQPSGHAEERWRPMRSTHVRYARCAKHSPVAVSVLLLLPPEPSRKTPLKSTNCLASMQHFPFFFCDCLVQRSVKTNTRTVTPATHTKRPHHFISRPRASANSKSKTVSDAPLTLQQTFTCHFYRLTAPQIMHARIRTKATTRLNTKRRPQSAHRDNGVLRHRNALAIMSAHQNSRPPVCVSEEN